MESFLNSHVQKFLKERANITERRDLWRTSLKQILKDHLDYCVKTFPVVDWYVQEHNDKENHESIYLAIGNVPSGIREKGGQLFMLMGGAVHFSQIHNGKIRVWMQYPEVPDIAWHDPSHEVLGDVEPKDLLNTSNIENFVAQFLLKQLENQPQEKRRPIGFNTTE